MPPNDWMKKYTGYLKDVEGSVIHGGKHVPYQDAGGRWTIGYGKLISKNDLGEGKLKEKKLGYGDKTIKIWVGGTSWDEKEAEQALQKEASLSLHQAEIYAKNKGFDWGKISDRQKYGLADFVYNLGYGSMTNPYELPSGKMSDQDLFHDTMGAYLSGENVVSSGDPNISHKRHVITSKGNFELKYRNKKWKDLFGGSQKEGELIMGSMLKLDNPLGMV